LFDIPASARADKDPDAGFPAGGFGGGHFTPTRAGDFRRWRLHPGLPERDEPVPADRFSAWVRQGRETTALPLCADPIHHPNPQMTPTNTDQNLCANRRNLWICHQHRLFPFTWRDYVTSLPLHLESLSFSPLLPGSLREASLPVHVVVWRAHNPTDAPLEAALMLTWACGWPDLVPEARFDFQHDNLCLTGSLGDPKSPNRMGIAVPDLHSQGIYQQGIEPWVAGEEERAVWEDFAEDGELDPALPRATPQGAAAWVKFDLAPQETKEIPFVIVWHFPLYESGPAAGQPRFYTQYLRKRRPDNAVIWLAEQVVEDYGAETANYRYWIQQIRDWQRPIEEDPALSPDEKQGRFNALSALLDVDAVWTDDGRFTLLPQAGQTWEGLRASLADALPIETFLPIPLIDLSIKR